MSDLDFKHNVSEIPRGEALPKGYQRNVTAEVTPGPDVQSAVSNYAANTNWMSNLGSAVAARASTAVAQKIGGDLGKNPQGDLGPVLTDFDKTMHESYQTQAQATLGLQANKLITDSNLEMAKAPRITPSLIAKTNQQVSIGLQNIFKNAPSEIRPDLEYQYGSLQLSQGEQLSNRMISEQRQDQKDTILASNRESNELATNLARSGNIKAAMAVVESTKKRNDSGWNSKLISKETAQVANESVLKSAQAGKVIYDYDKAKSEGKGEQFLADLHKRKDVTPDQLDSMANALITHVGQENALNSQNEQLRLSQYNTSLAMNPVSPDLANQLQVLQENVSPIAYQKAVQATIQARKAWEQNSAEQLDLTHNWGDSAALARSSEKHINRTFDNLVANVVQKQGISREEAEVQVAMSAGAPVPVFVKTLNDKLTSGNPANIQAAALQIQALRDVEGGHALIGLSQQGQAIAIQFQHQQGSMPDSDLARKITDDIVNIDPSMQKTLDNMWTMQLSKGGAGGLGASKSLAGFALEAVGANPKNLGGTYFQTIYGNDLYENLKSNFDAARGDYATAKQMTKDYYNQNYAETRMNGDITISDHPLEKALGYKDHDVVPFIQQDFLNQVKPILEKNKTEDDSWSIKPLKAEDTGPRSTFRKMYPPAELVRNVKTKDGMKQYSYPVNFIGRPGNQWDVVVQTPSGPRNLFLVAPQLGIITYKPNAESIANDYNAHAKKGWL